MGATRLARLLAANASGERPLAQRLAWLAFGFVLFTLVIPAVLLVVGRLAAHLLGPLAAGPVVRAAGLVLSPLGLALAGWTVWEQWTAGRGTPVPWVPTQALVCDGPYALCRNPMALGMITHYLALGLVLDSLTAGLVMAAIPAVLGREYVTRVEEPALALRFGAAYEDYRSRVPRFFPWPRPRG